MRRIEMKVHGDPAPQGSKRSIGNNRMIEASKKVGPWREAVVGEVLRQGHALNLHSLLQVRITFQFVRPKAHYLSTGLRPNAPKYVGRTPDIDKLCRSTLDGLVQAGVMLDDKQVVILHAQKVYVDESPGAVILIEELP